MNNTEPNDQDQDKPGDASEATDSQVILGPSSRQGRLPVIFAAGILLLVILVILGTTTHIFDPLVQRFLSPTPTPLPPLARGDDLFYFRIAPWGSITIDGNPIAKLPTQQGDTPIRLSRGLHQVIWHADPFQPIACTVSVPYLFSSEPCTLETSITTADGAVRLINFAPTLANLTTEQRNALELKAQSALDSLRTSDTVLSGEQYAVISPSQSAPQAVTATQPLHATLRFHLDTNPASSRTCPQFNDDCALYNEQNCYTFCTSYGNSLPDALSQTPTQSTQKTWNVLAVAYATWDYTTSSGRVIAQDQPDASSAVVDPDHGIFLHMNWDGQTWHVAAASATENFRNTSTTVFPNFELACATMQEYVNANSNFYLTTTQDPSHTQLDWAGFSPGTNRSQGCLGVSVPHQTNTSTLQHGAYFLYRFGVLMAANDLAHHYFPDLPLADAYEQSIAQHIAVTRFKKIIIT